MLVAFLISLVFARPYVADLSALTFYVEQLSLDNKTDAPPLGFLSNVEQLSSAVQNLHESWESRKLQLQAAVAESKIVFDTLPDILVMLDADYMVRRANESAFSVLGKKIIGQPLSKVVKNPDLATAVKQVVATNQGSEIEISYSPRHVTRDYSCKIRRFPIHTHKGIAILLMMVDITESKQSKRMVKDFVANASHEIRTPLTSLIGFIETLEDGALEDKKAARKFLSVMSVQAGHMNNLVQDLLSLSKVEMNENTTPSDDVDLVEICKTAIRNLKWLADKKDMKLVLDTQEDHIEMKGDAHELLQVCTNLASNAIKYGKTGTDVHVALSITSETPGISSILMQQKRVVRLDVTDEGEGISAEDIPRLTERFFRVDKVRSKTVSGTGLGLCIVSHIINRHQGALDIRSELGKGSVFSVYFPFA